MNTGNRVFSIICVGISIWLILESFRFNYMVKYTPGPGFMPFWIGLVLLIFAIAQFIETFKKRGGKEDRARRLPAKHSMYRLGLIMLITAGMALLMNSLGFTLAVILFVSTILYFMENINIIRSIITGVIFGACTFLVFQYWLELSLPTGLWGF